MGSWKSYVCHGLFWTVVLDTGLVKAGVLRWKEVEILSSTHMQFHIWSSWKVFHYCWSTYWQSLKLKTNFIVSCFLCRGSYWTEERQFCSVSQLTFFWKIWGAPFLRVVDAPVAYTSWMGITWLSLKEKSCSSGIRFSHCWKCSNLLIVQFTLLWI